MSDEELNDFDIEISHFLDWIRYNFRVEEGPKGTKRWISLTATGEPYSYEGSKYLILLYKTLKNGKH